ncbi:acyltransferase [Marinifilum sp. D737]|uniref:acyltransferase n=1 Tax=Marinifilum sp. D737 TaxID=2969628 RepID=UPI002274954A|nr:acyltransferase [Marinifilum sp. D737]MCY1635005.1 acyltransferase [Marinifilum sp. D737]
MLSIRIENKLRYLLERFKSRFRSFLLFGNINKIKFGRKVKLSGQIKLGENISIRDYTNIKGKNINIGDNVFIHENVFIRGLEYINIGEGTTINRNTSILDKVNIGKFCSIAPNVVIVGSNHNYENKNELIKQQGSECIGITIEDDVWIATNVSILDGVTVGKGSIVAAGAVVNKNIPEYSIVAGVPARVMKKRK